MYGWCRCDLRSAFAALFSVIELPESVPCTAIMAGKKSLGGERPFRIH